jgi:hypothetical protein
MLHRTIRMPNVPPYTQHSQHFWSSPWNPPAYHWCRNHKVWHNLLGPVKCWKVSHLGKLENNTVTTPIESRTACASVATVNILSRTSTFRVKALLRVLVAWIRAESTSGVQGSVHPPPPPPPSGVQHPLEENSGIPYLSCEYYLLHIGTIDFRIREKYSSTNTAGHHI